MDSNSRGIFRTAYCPGFVRGTPYQVSLRLSNRLVVHNSLGRSHGFHTYLLALLISLLAVFTPAYILGPPTLGNDTQSAIKRMTWVRLFAEFS